jgi:hypothetical protein
MFLSIRIIYLSIYLLHIKYRNLTIESSKIGKVAVTDLTVHPSILFIHVIHIHHILSIVPVEKS